MTKLPDDTVLRLFTAAETLAAQKWSAIAVVPWSEIDAGEQQELTAIEFAALIQAELEKADNEVSDAHDLLDRHQVPRNTKFGIPLSLLGRIATSFTDERL